MTISVTRSKVEQPFPGYLTFQNGMVGAFYVPGWSGPEEGFMYHSVPSNPSTTSQIFTEKDYLWTVVLPAISGLMFFLLGVVICFYFPISGGRWPFLLFHFFAGMYVVLTPDFHLTYHFTYLLMICFALIPASIFHFALLFPENKNVQLRWKSIPYLVSLGLMVPYIGLFSDPSKWIYAEYAVFTYLLIAYFFWIYRLISTRKNPQLQLDRIVAKYLLLGQLIAFTIPLIASLAIFIWNISFPLNFASPFILIFPISVFMGLLLGRLKQSQIQLVQSEKRAALGSLFAGLAHEINNPMTFVYSAIEPLRESLQKLQSQNIDPKAVQDISEYVAIIEEGATRAKSIVENFRSFSYGNVSEKTVVSIHEILDQSIRFTSSITKDHADVVRRYDQDVNILGSRTELGQVFINLISNAAHAIVNQGTIEVRTKNHPDFVEIYVRDSGQGMSSGVLNKIFDPFFTTKQQGEGTGLGLSITLDIIQKHGGKIEVSSTPGKGSEFAVTLPRSL